VVQHTAAWRVAPVGETRWMRGCRMCTAWGIVGAAVASSRTIDYITGAVAQKPAGHAPPAMPVVDVVVRYTFMDGEQQTQKPRCLPNSEAQIPRSSRTHYRHQGERF